MTLTGTVLIVDDVPAMQRMIADLLRDDGYQLEFATNGYEALERAETSAPDLILLDVMMPEIDGFEVCRLMRATASTADIPILMITALTDRTSRLLGFQAGADDFISKPFDRTELRARVRTITRLNRHRRLLAERARFESLTELSPDGVFTVDEAGLVRLANPAMMHMLGANHQAQLIEQPAIALVDPSHRQAFTRLFEQVMGTSVQQRIESLFVRRTGELFPVEINAGRFDWNRQPMVQIIARDITERKRAEETLQLRNQELAVLNRAGQVFSSSLDIQQVLANVLDELCSLLEVTGSSAWLVDAATNELICWQATGPGSQALCNWRLAPGEGLAGWTCATGESLVVFDAQADERHSRTVDELTGQAHHAVLAVPLGAKNRHFGVLQLFDTRVNRFKPSDLHLVEALAAIATIAVENALLFRATNLQRSQLRALTARLAEVQERERQHLARELHDCIGQNLTTLSLNLNIIEPLLPESTPPVINDRLRDSLEVIGETSRRVRNVMAELRPPVLDDYGLLAALRWYGEQFAGRTGLVVRVDGRDPEERLALHLETALFRIAQEALNNVAKHAHASTVWIQQEPLEDRFRLSIADDGIGFDVASGHKVTNSPHWGLLTMQERAVAAGGTIRLDSTPGQGTRVVVEIEGHAS